MLKKIFLIIVFIFINFINTIAIDLNDEKTIKKLEDTIYKIYNEKWIDEINRLSIRIDNIKIKNKDNINNLIFLVKFSDILNYYINKEKIILEEKKINNNKDNLKNFHLNFINTYWNEINWNIEDKCINNYDFIDKIAKKYNFPTELIIATWRKESWCNMINPNNWDWLFQIRANYYIPWKINQEKLEEQIIDFITYSHNKWIYFQKNKKLKQDFNQETLNITYNNYTLKDLQIHAMLYNWISKKYTLETSKYANWNINKNIITDTDWVITLLIKSLKKIYSM